MNKARRAEINKVIETLKLAQEALEYARDEEQEYYDNMPEGLQAGDKGSAAEQAVSDLDAAVVAIDEVISYAQQAVGD